MKYSEAISKSKKPDHNRNHEVCHVCIETDKRRTDGYCDRCPLRAEVRYTCDIGGSCGSLHDLYNGGRDEVIGFIDSIEMCCREQGD